VLERLELFMFQEVRDLKADHTLRLENSVDLPQVVEDRCLGMCWNTNAQ
jgi:hypothetical protein